MTDLEMTRLCAEAMEIATVAPPKGYEDLIIIAGLSAPYVPLHDDAQAMALVKKFRLTISPSLSSDETFAWAVELEDESAHSDDLNRAIVECVAEMQARPRKIPGVATAI